MNTESAPSWELSQSQERRLGALIAESEVQALLDSYSPRVTDLIRTGDHSETIQMRMFRLAGDFYDRNSEVLHNLFPQFSPNHLIIYTIPDLIRKFWKDMISYDIVDDLQFKTWESIDDHAYVQLGLWKILEDQLDPVFAEIRDHRNWLDKILGKDIIEDSRFLYYGISDEAHILTPYAEFILEQYATIHSLSPYTKRRQKIKKSIWVL